MLPLLIYIDPYLLLVQSSSSFLYLSYSNLSPLLLPLLPDSPVRSGALHRYRASSSHSHTDDTVTGYSALLSNEWDEVKAKFVLTTRNCSDSQVSPQTSESGRSTPAAKYPSSHRRNFHLPVRALSCRSDSHVPRHGSRGRKVLVEKLLSSGDGLGKSVLQGGCMPKLVGN